jgi:hypothetical protein
MINMPYDDIIRKIKEKQDITDEVLNAKIKKKMDQLSGLISKEGAAYIVANDLGVKLVQTEGLVKLKDVVPGQRNVEIAGKVTRMFDLIEFNKNDRKGKVRTMILADETAQMKVTAWHDQTALYETFKEGDIVKIKNGFVKSNQGQTETHLNNNSKITVNPPDIKIEGVSEFKKPEVLRKKINEITENDQNIEVFGTIVQVYDPRYFEQCPECRKKPNMSEGNFVCAQHGAITPMYGYVINIMLDDGTDTIRAVMFKEQMQQLFKKTDDELLTFRTSNEGFDELKREILGEQIIVNGRIIKNEMFDRLEIRSNKVTRDVNPDKEIERIKSETPEKEIGELTQTVNTKSLITPENSEEKEEIELVEDKPVVDEEVVPVQNTEETVVEKEEVEETQEEEKVETQDDEEVTVKSEPETISEDVEKTDDEVVTEETKSEDDEEKINEILDSDDSEDKPIESEEIKKTVEDEETTETQNKTEEEEEEKKDLPSIDDL